MAGRPLRLSITTLDKPIGSSVVLGLNGAFLGSSFGYPLGANRFWTLADDRLATTGQIQWNTGSRPLPSPDGSRVAYIAAAPDRRGLTVRDVAGGLPRFLLETDRAPYEWLDDDHVLIDPPEEHGVTHSIDVRDGSNVVVFRPFTPPTPNPAGSAWDGWIPSGDLRWAILQRADDRGVVSDQWVYDTANGRIVATLGSGAWELGPRGDIAVSFDGGKVRVMHLCDRRIVELGTRAGSAAATGSWSPDGRYLAMSFGPTFDDTGPESVVIVEPAAGRFGVLNGPWGFLYTWSSDLRFVGLGRRGYHDLAARLAHLEIDPR
jgi:hypothetical protein